MPYRVRELSGYGPRIVKGNVELLRSINEQIRGSDKELRKIANEDPQAKRLMTLIGVGPTSAVAVSCLTSKLLGPEMVGYCRLL